MSTQRGVATGLYLIFWGFMIALCGLVVVANGWQHGQPILFIGMVLGCVGVAFLVVRSPFLSHRSAMALVLVLIMALMLVVLDIGWRPPWQSPLYGLIPTWAYVLTLYGTWPALSFAMWWFSIRARLVRCEASWLITAFLFVIVPLVTWSPGFGFDAHTLAAYAASVVTASFFFISLLRTRRGVLDGTLTRSEGDTKADDGPAELPKDSP